MNIHIEESIQIDAGVERVWQVLSAFHLYAEWSPTLGFYQRELRVGERAQVSFKQPGMKTILMKPTILRLEACEELRWSGHFVVQGLFDGEHYFLLEALAADKTRFVQGEYFSGLLVPFLKKMINNQTLEGFKLFNAALKKRVEEHSL